MACGIDDDDGKRFVQFDGTAWAPVIRPRVGHGC